MQVSAVHFKRYHGCRRLNRNGTRQLIVWKRGEQCIVPTNTTCWKPTKEKYLSKKVRQGTGRD